MRTSMIILAGTFLLAGCDLFEKTDPDEVLYHSNGVGEITRRYQVTRGGAVSVVGMVGATYPYEDAFRIDSMRTLGFAIGAICPPGDCYGDAELRIGGRLAYGNSTRGSIVDPLNHMHSYTIGAAVGIGQSRPTIAVRIIAAEAIAGRYHIRTPADTITVSVRDELTRVQAQPGDTVSVIFDGGTGPEFNCVTMLLSVRTNDDSGLPLVGGEFCAPNSTMIHELHAVVPR